MPARRPDLATSLTGMITEMAVPVHGALCFTDATWPLFRRSFQIDGIWVTSPNSLVRLIVAPGHLDRSAILRIVTRLSKTLPPAVR